MPIAALLAGVTEFLILDGVDQFPLLAIGMAPVVLAAALLSTSPNQRLASIAYLVLVFFLVILAPANPQSYNPDTYLFSSLMAIISVILLFVLLRIVLPTSDARRRRWYLTSHERHARPAGRWPVPRLDDEALFRDADRVGQLAALQPAADDERRDDSVRLSTSSDLRPQHDGPDTLAELSARTDGRWLKTDIRPWPPVIPLACARPQPIFASTQPSSIMMVRQQLAPASLDLIWAAFRIDASRFGLDPHRSTAS